MQLKGNLVGYKTAKSQKGNDCFFGYLLLLDSNDDRTIGHPAVQISAFGGDAVTLFKKVTTDKLLDKDVIVNGYYNNNQFYAVTLDKA